MLKGGAPRAITEVREAAGAAHLGHHTAARCRRCVLPSDAPGAPDPLRCAGYCMHYITGVRNPIYFEGKLHRPGSFPDQRK